MILVSSQISSAFWCSASISSVLTGSLPFAAPELISTFCSVLFSGLCNLVLLNHQQLSLSQHFGSVPLACKLCAVALGGKGLVWCSSQLFGSVLLGSSESQTGSCRKSRAQSKIGASPAANKCFQFVASPPDAACGGAAEAGVSCHEFSAKGANN